jgi:putative methionine-R-sulfoxide reductase with GAF domain
LKTTQNPTESSLGRQLRSLLSGQNDLIANAANLAALLFHELEGHISNCVSRQASA